MERRDFLRAAAGAAAALGAGATPADAHAALAEHGARRRGAAFQLDYAPHFGMFRHYGGESAEGQLEFMAEEGFRALEDNTMTRRSVAEQERIAAAMERLGMRMGVFVANFDTAFGVKSFTSGKSEHVESFLADLRKSVEVAGRVNARWMTVVLGDAEPGLESEYQTANAIDMLRRGAEILEPHGLVMVLEPLNPWANHPGMFLSRIPQAYQICKAVDSPSVKILNDLYHQQVTEGNLIPNIDMAWDEIAYFQIGDNPGRNEPTTGEIHYRNVFRHIHGKGFQGILGMEHGNSLPGKEGERAVIDAYRWCDDY